MFRLKNTSCPFSLDNYDKLYNDNNVIILKFNRSSFFYDVKALYEYIFIHKKFKDPFTRNIFTFEHLDYVLYKSFLNGKIKGDIIYKNKKLKSPDAGYYYDLSNNFFYIRRIIKVLQFNNFRYPEITKILEEYFFQNENVDPFSESYVSTPIVYAKNHHDDHISNRDLQFMISNKKILRSPNFTDPLSGCRFDNFDNIIKLKITKWQYYNCDTLFESLFENFQFHNLSIEQIDFICFKFNESMNLKHGKNAIPCSPYNIRYSSFNKTEHGNMYKLEYILRINTFICLFNRKFILYEDNDTSFLYKFWKSYYKFKSNTQNVLLFNWPTQI